MSTESTEITPDDPATPFHDARKKGKFAKNPTTTLYAAVGYKDAQGEHKAGSVITLPSDTPEQQAEIDTMIRYGVLTKTKPKA